MSPNLAVTELTITVVPALEKVREASIVSIENGVASFDENAAAVTVSSAISV